MRGCHLFYYIPKYLVVALWSKCQGKVETDALSAMAPYCSDMQLFLFHVARQRLHWVTIKVHSLIAQKR
jgi:hypothetical protein